MTPKTILPDYCNLSLNRYLPHISLYCRITGSGQTVIHLKSIKTKKGKMKAEIKKVMYSCNRAMIFEFSAVKMFKFNDDTLFSK